ncbi:hypothetical protein ACIOTI_36445 [Streptomyces sp. NPDC087843]|uniref:hypothetical protein n=1 Tax=Streptomyces sp. NPDC087843 TaxID=3365804 RepID=UPI00382428EB
MKAVLALLKTSAGSTGDKERPSEETLNEAIERYADASVTAEQLAGVLGNAFSGVGRLTYKGAAESARQGCVRLEGGESGRGLLTARPSSY